MKPSLVYYRPARLVHYEAERPAGRPQMGSPGGVTMCGTKFVPRGGTWSRDPRLARHGAWGSCAECLGALAEKLGLPVSSPASPTPRSTP